MTKVAFPQPRHPKACQSQSGFMLAPLLYILALGGIGAAVMFSGYSQVLRSNAEMTAINSVRQQLNSAAQILSASSSLDADTSTILNPPAVKTLGAVTDSTRLPNTPTTTTPDPVVLGTYVNNGSNNGYGVIDPSSGMRQLDPWGKYFLYCRWDSATATPASPSIMVVSAGPDGVVQTKCGDTTAQGDDRINKLSVAEAINRANVWQVNGASQVKYGAAANAVQVNSDGSLQASSLTIGTTTAATAGNITVQGGITLGTALSITNGGTGATSASLARVNLSVPDLIGTNAAGTWGIDITGNAGTATALQTARNFSIAGSTGLTAANVSFNGSADVALSLAGTLAVANGGTGGVTASAARTNLAVLGIANNLSDVANAGTARTNLAVLGIANNLSDLNNVATARTNLGLGTMATQNANAVAITGGTITGVTITGNVSGSAGSVAADAITGCCVPLSAGGTGVNAISNANLRFQLGINNASGFVPTAQLGSGIADNTVFLRGDSTWAIVPAGITGTGTTNYIPMWNNGSLTNSALYQSSGNVGIGNTNSSYNLDVTGTLHTTGSPTFDSMVITNAGLQTQSQDNITSRMNSGWYQTSAATTANGWPLTSNGWYHLFSSTHTNPGNYYSFQLAADFFNNTDFFVRVTNNNGANTWKRIITDDGSGNGVFTGTVTAATPTASTHLATKAYVDTAVAGASGGSGGVPTNFQVFTSSGTWTKPGSGSMAKVECWGGGGGGTGSSASTYYNGFSYQCGIYDAGGGGGGGYAYAWFPLTSLTSTVSITIGAGGTGGTGYSGCTHTGVAGAAGGNSTFGGYLTASGGAGGNTGTGGGGSGTNVAFTYGGNAGISGGNAASGSMSGGEGGNATNGSMPGGGGSGSRASSSIYNGYAGGAGECTVTTY